MSDIFTRLLLNADGFNKNLYQAQKNLRGFANTSKGVFGGLTKFTSYAAAFVGISTSIHSAVTSNMEFEKSLSSLRSLTGVTADELNYFRTEAIRMGMDSTQSATQMVDAFKLIGSQMPELLKNKTALTQTAEAAVVLSEAAELDVPTAAKALTGALNQMGAGSSEASNYINILAAASQQGSADIPYLNKAIENAGGAASSTGVKFNELVAIIEAIAPKITDAASAGTNLRNIFLTLESSSDQNLRPSVVGLSTAIDNLSKKNLDAVQLTKMFGKESVTAAIAILQEKDSFDSLSKSIEGTNTAYDQASINNDNLAGSISKLHSAWESFINSMSKSNGIIKSTTDALTTMINAASRLMMSSDDRKKYDLDKKYGSQAKAVLGNSNEWINERVEEGTNRNKAIDDEIAAMGRMYPLALKYEGMLQEYEQKKAQYEKRFDAELGSSLTTMKKELSIVERQYYIYEYVIENLKAQKKEIEDKANKELAAAKAAKEKANAEIAAEKAKEKATRPKGSIASIDYEISQKNKEISVAISDVDRIKLNTELDQLVKKKRYLNLTIEYSKPVDNIKQIKDFQGIKSQIAQMTLLPEGWNKITAPQINNQGIKEQINTMNEYENAIQSVESAISNLSGTFDQDSQNAFSYFANIVKGAAQAVIAIMALIPAKKAEANANAEAAVTGAASSVASIPFVGAAMAVAAVAGIIASLAAIPKFAKGGIIGGSSFYGDRLLARVNSGEMILNKEQQKSMYKMTSGGNDINITSFKVRGSDLYLSLKNYMKRTGKTL